MSVATLNPAQPWENENGPRRCVNTAEGLTHSSGTSREGLGVKPTHCQHPDGCDRSIKGHGWCKPHLERLRKTGTVGPAFIEPRASARRACRVDDCSTPVGWTGGFGLCSMHYQRWRKHGDPSVVAKGGASQPLAANPNWSGEDASYAAIHLRLGRHRGLARDLSCVDCGAAAAHWSYDNADPSERVDQRLGRYSTDLDHYQPRCVPCHNAFDKAAQSARESA